MPIDMELQTRFEDCVDSCADSMYRVAFRMTGNGTLASELVQETYLNAWRNIASLSDPSKMRGWMFAILRNQYSKLIRNEVKAANTSEFLEQVPEKESTDDRNDAVDEVQTALAELDEKHKLPLLLVSMEGMSVDQASEVLDLPRGTVLSRLHRGRQKMKEILMRNESRRLQNSKRPASEHEEVGDEV